MSLFSNPTLVGSDLHGVVLAQKQKDGSIHLIAYASRTLDFHERNYGISEMETLAFVYTVCYFRAYLLGHNTTVYTDYALSLLISLDSLANWLGGNPRSKIWI